MTWFCYLLFSENTQRTYVGATVNITRRLRQHNGELRGGAKRTSSGRPWKIVALVEVGEKIPALKLEWKLKRARGKTKRLALFTKLCTDNNLPVNIFSSAARNYSLVSI